MTNKPMLSVERELLERAASAIEKHHGSLQWVIASELRALLDTELHNGDPVVRYCTHPPGCKSCSWCGFKAAQHQVAPAGWATELGLQGIADAAKTTWPSFVSISSHQSNHDGLSVALYREQPASVAVVHTMKSIMEAVEASRCYTVLTSDQCYALAQSLNGVNK